MGKYGLLFHLLRVTRFLGVDAGHLPRHPASAHLLALSPPYGVYAPRDCSMRLSRPAHLRLSLTLNADPQSLELEQHPRV